MAGTQVERIHAREILDSRGRPTVEVELALRDGSSARAAVPSGASTGASEAHEMRDGDAARFDGYGVQRAVAAVNGEIAQALRGADAADQGRIDAALRELDGTPALGRLGANAVLGVSMAACRAAAAAARRPLYRHLAELAGCARPQLPMPLVNILSGGLHARAGMDVQDLQVVPVAARSVGEAIHLAARVRSAADRVVARHGSSTLLADEGGLSPSSRTTEEALAMVCEAIREAGLAPGAEVTIAMDVAASSLQAEDSTYHFAREGMQRDSRAMIALLESWLRDYPVASIEDGLGEEDWPAWSELTRRTGARVTLIGDDLFTTSTERLARGARSGAANAVLVKLNQNGTVSGTLDVIATARKAGYATIVSARSGETCDAFIADLAVGTAAGYIKIGSLRNSERLAKYNQLLRIAEDAELGFSEARAMQHRGGAPARS